MLNTLLNILTAAGIIALGLGVWVGMQGLGNALERKTDGRSPRRLGADGQNWTEDDKMWNQENSCGKCRLCREPREADG
ncbi:MAG: hypothetical protein OEW39_09240 [Deltaproteobacteria bacterium]|nr:hypothetical protein [Deltaproteobacteria bacterium]